MPSAPTSLGPYRIERELGRGGMGVVYLAHDTRLHRRVAIKALPDAVASDPERMARFEREARMLASLNHPNLAAVYDVLELESRRYLAMEYIEGESLADRLRRDGALAPSDAIEICRQIAAGIEAAHEGGVVHRDLKPDNIMITSGERVKVVDFGLAKGRVDEGLARGHAVSPVLASSPTVATPDTMPGVILGTAPYLSPEQARGRVVDRRTDIWSFGCTLFECLTGRKLFLGETVPDTIAKVLERPLDLSGLPKETPPRIRELLNRCLERDPRKRLRDIGEAGLMLEDAQPSAASPAAPAAPKPLWRRFAPIVGAVAAIVLAARLFGPGLLTRLRGPVDPIRRVSIEIPPDLSATYWQLTPDGSTLLVQARHTATPNAPHSIYRRRLDETEFHRIPGTEGVGGFGMSPDGSRLYFLVSTGQGPEATLKRVPVDGSAPVVSVIPWQTDWIPGAVLSSGKFLFSFRGDQWSSLDPAGTQGPVEPFGIPDLKGEVLFGDVLPDDRAVLVHLPSSKGAVPMASLGVLDLRSKKVKVLLENVGGAFYRSSRLFVTRGGTLFAVPFDLGKLEVRGEPVPLIDRLYTPPGAVSPVVAYTSDGTLAYQPGPGGDEPRRLISVDRGGAITSWSPASRPFDISPRLSPDGSRIVCGVTGSQNIRQLWIVDRGRPSAELITEGAGYTMFGPAWSPDGSRIAFGLYGGRQDGIYIKDVQTGSPAEHLVRSPQAGWRMDPSVWTSDGSTLLVSMGTMTEAHIGAVSTRPTKGSQPTMKPLFSDNWYEVLPALSHDGAWLAYESMLTGRREIYARPFLAGPAVGKAVQVSTDGGARPVWSRRGNTLYFESTDDRVMSTSLQNGPSPSFSPPSPAWNLSALRIAANGWDIAPDGSLVGIQKAEGEDDLRRIDLVLHFDRELEAKMKASRN